MGFIDSASNWSKINGYDYYENGNVLSVRKINDNEYHATVKGSNNRIYSVNYIPNHPKKTTCDCPRANGKLSVCKHKIAVYYYLNPDAALIVKKKREDQLRLEEQLKKEFMERHNKRVEKATKFVESLSLEEMKRVLINYKVNELEEDEERYNEYYYDEEEYYW